MKYPNRRLWAAGRSLLLAATAASLPITPVSAEQPMKTGEIRISGNHKIKTYILRRAIPLVSGRPFNEAKVGEARRNVREIPGVDYSEVRVTYSPVDSALSLNVRITEKSALHSFPMMRRGLENEFTFGAWVTENNFRGRSEKLGASLLVVNGVVAAAFWENPWLGSGLRFGVGAGADYKRYRYVYDDLGGVFDGSLIQRVGGEFQLFYTFGWGLRLYAAAGYEWAEGDRTAVTNDPDGDRFPVFPVGVRYDGRGSDRWPWSGWYLHADVTAVGPGDDLYSIISTRFDLRAFLPIFDRTVFGVQIRADVNEGDRIPVYMREHIGGGLTLRGHEYGDFNATSAIVTGAEFRIPINFNRRRTVEDLTFAASLHLFVDAGAAWELGESPDDRELWNAGYGLGILLLNKWVKGLRVDYGWREGWEGLWHFEIGAKF